MGCNQLPSHSGGKMMKKVRIMSFHSTFFSEMIRINVFRKILVGAIFFSVFLTACTPPQPLPSGPTPIPTLIPATIPPNNIEPTEIPAQVVESYPAGLPSASRGQDLYVEHCATCHGVDGNGVVPNARNFGDVDYMRGETPAEFYTIIAEGRGADMPTFGEELTSDERWAVVYYVWRFSTTSDTLQQGHEIYQSNCVSCHGEDGRSMILGAANFSDQRFMAHQPPSDLYVSVTQGQGSMPAWQARLSQDDRWAVIDYIRTFTYEPQIGEEAEIESASSTSNEDERPECAPYLEQDNPFEWDNADAIAAGQTLYNDNCEGCHGEDGTGRLPGIIDFTDPTTQADLRNSTSRYLCSIAEGYQSMPQFKDEFNEEEMWQLLVWMAAFGE
jgi:mono/diheme cytochrome c family protein